MTFIKIILFIVILFFLLTRLYKISEIPGSVYWDEASIGVNAHSVLKTGRDEWGESYPLHFRAFGEFKLPVYIYSTLPFVAIFGLSPLSVRLPAVLYSVACLILIYLIIKKITGKELLGVVGASLLVISPWFLIFSRAGYEAVAGLAFYLLGIYLFMLFDKKILFISLSAISFLVSMYSYTSFRIIAPITFFVLSIFLIRLNKFNFKKIFLIYLISGIIFILGIIPIIRLIIYDSGFGRLSTISVIPLVRWVTGPSGKSEFQIIKATSSSDKKPDFLKNYTYHFSLDFLLFSGDKNYRNHSPGVGQIYYLDLLFLVLGAFVILKQRKKEYLLVLTLLLISVIPASLTLESPHALRSLSMVVFLIIISTLGLDMLFSYFKDKSRSYVYFLIVILYGIFFGSYYINFIQNYNKASSGDWQYGYKEVYESYSEKFTNYDHVLITDQYAQPYIFYLFYSKFDPRRFKESIKYDSPDRWGFSTVKSINNIQYQKIDENKIPSGKNLIFSSNNDQLTISPKDIIKSLDGSNLIYVYEISK